MTASTQAVSDVVLRDGSTMRFHPPGREDADALLAFFEGLSDRSLYLRFHGHPSVDERLVQPVLEPDWSERGALVGTKDERVVALGRIAAAQLRVANVPIICVRHPASGGAALFRRQIEEIVRQM